MYIFKARAEVHYNPEIGFFYSYAIEAYEEYSDKCILCIHDVFANELVAKAFVELMNNCQPELVHLEELCVDFIG